MAACHEAEVGGPGLPSLLEPASAVHQTGRLGQLAGSSPAVVVRDPDGKPVAGVAVAFAVTGGGGTASPSTAVTGDDGVARTVWQLGAGGTQSLEATSEEVPGAVVAFSVELLPSTGYAIDLRLLGEVSDAQWAAFTGAAGRISQVIVGALPPLDLGTGARCDGNPVTGVVDGLLILVDIHLIDGAGGILGQAGPCIVRSTSHLPAVGVMELDSADVDRMETNGSLGSVVLHEMLHVIGFGTVWDSWARNPEPSLVSGAGTLDSAFLGAGALSAATGWNAAPAGWTTVPLENCGSTSPQPCGSGTRDSHWLEPIFGNELMTGWLSGGAQPFSRTTAGSLADLGYEVNLDAADSFDLAATLRGNVAAAALVEPPVYLGEDVLNLPIEVVP